MNIACIPAYNEEKTIGDIVKKSLEFVDRVIVCDDGSTDNTAKIAEAAGAQIIKHKKNSGYGASIISLFDKAREENVDYMITLDGDGQHSPEEIPVLLETITQHNVDLVIGSRLMKRKENIPSYRLRGIKIITSASNFGTNLNISDSQSGFRAYSKRAIFAIHPTETGMSVSTEILLKISNKGLSLAEVPISIRYGPNTSSKNPLPHGISVLMSTIKFVSLKHPIAFYGIPGISLIITGIIFGFQFFDAYLNKQTVFYGSLLISIVLFLVGSILSATSVILFSIANLMKQQE